MMSFEMCSKCCSPLQVGFCGLRQGDPATLQQLVNLKNAQSGKMSIQVCNEALALPALTYEAKSRHRENLNSVPLPSVHRTTQLRPIQIVQSYSPVLAAFLNQCFHLSLIICTRCTNNFLFCVTA